MKAIIIPARMASKRFPGKPLKEAGGKSLLEWTYNQASKSNARHVIVATPDDEIMTHCKQIGASCMMTSEEAETGTHRVAECMSQLKGVYHRVVNLQVDEPLVEVGAINRLLDAEGKWAEDSIYTLIAPLSDGDALDVNATKVIYARGRCYWFSRASMAGAQYHVGVYAYSPRVLNILSFLEPTRYSLAESLEQLAWIQAGIIIRPMSIDVAPLSVNTPEDFEKFKKLVES